jgi:RNA polymerase sigma factor (sigma-70 family)
MEIDKLQHKLSTITQKCPAELTEQKECHDLLSEAINNILPEKSKNLIFRRYGLGQYYKNEQSAIAIAKEYGVTRSSIYQLEQSAIKKLKKYLEKNNIHSSCP